MTIRVGEIASGKPEKPSLGQPAFNRAEKRERWQPSQRIFDFSRASATC